MGAKVRNMGAKVKGIESTDVESGQYPDKRVGAIIDVLQREWGHAVCELDHNNAFQLTIATILSAQSTDKRVNIVTPELFARFPSPQSLAEANLAEVEKLIFSTGFYRNKAKNIIKMAQQLITDFGGEIPRTLEEMITLAGVARKTANVVLGTAFGIPSGVVVDTHIKRLSNRLGLSAESNPVKVERDLMKILPKEKWIDFGHQIIWHGRRICDAKKPLCQECALAPLCPSIET